MSNPCWDAVVRELRYANIKPHTEYLGKHVSVQWDYNGQSRSVTIPATPGDWRSSLNARSMVRRILRDDGINVDAHPRPQPKLNKLERAFSLPDQLEESIPKRMDRLERDMQITIDMLLEVAPHFSAVQDAVRLGEDSPAFKISVPVSAAALGVVMTRLYEMGFAVRDVRVAPILSTSSSATEERVELTTAVVANPVVEEPIEEEVVEESVEEPVKHRSSYATGKYTQPILDALRDGPKTGVQLIEVLIPKDAKMDSQSNQLYRTLKILLENGQITKLGGKGSAYRLVSKQ